MSYSGIVNSYPVTIENDARYLGMTPTQQVNELEKVLGRIPDVARHDFVHNQSRNYGDMTEYLKSKAPNVVRPYVTGLIMEGYASPFKKLLPMRQLRPNEPITFEWMEINFDPAFAPQVEVEGVAPIFTHGKAKRGARAVRRAVGIKIESGFYMTPSGQEEWKLKIQHLAAIVLRTTEYDILLTILQTPWRRHRHANELNGPTNIYSSKNNMSFHDRFELDKKMFGIVNKSADSRGFSNLVNQVKIAMKRQGVDPTAIIVPPYLMGFYYYTKPDLWEAHSAGDAAAQTNRARANAIPSGGKQSYQLQGMEIIDTYVFRPIKGGDEDPVDLLTVTRQIGEFYVCDINEQRKEFNKFKHFSTADRSLWLFNERHGKKVEIRFDDMIKNANVWKDPRWDDENENGENGKIDPDMSNVNGEHFLKDVETFSDIHPKYLPEEHIRRVVESIKANALGSEDEKELNAAINSYIAMTDPNNQPTRIRTENGIFTSTSADFAEQLRLAKQGLMRGLKQKIHDLFVSVDEGGKLPAIDLTNQVNQFEDVLEWYCHL